VKLTSINGYFFERKCSIVMRGIVDCGEMVLCHGSRWLRMDSIETAC
jgi:hypothetical protein